MKKEKASQYQEANDRVINITLEKFHTNSITQKTNYAKYSRKKTAFLMIVTALAATSLLIPVALMGENNSRNVLAETVPHTHLSSQIIIFKPQESPQSSKPYQRYPLSNDERYLIERTVMAEAEGEPLEGQMLVAQCILNASEKSKRSPSDVLTAYQYATTQKAPSQSVKNAVKSVFDDGISVTDEPILYFYNPSIVKSTWHESQIFVMEVGGHRFFAERSEAP